jgi:hypothetical protein
MRKPKTKQDMPSAIEMMIDAACGVNAEPELRKLTKIEKEACTQLGRDVLSDLRFYYPDALKGVPKTAAIHLRNTVTAKAEMMLRNLPRP